MKKSNLQIITVVSALLFSAIPTICTTLDSAGNITYTLQRESNPSADQLDAYARIVTAMDSAVGYYNRYTTITKRLTVQYNTGVATADANFNGNIRFGSNRSYMVVPTAMHEISHTVGIGTTSEYRNLIQNGVFTGAHATAMLREISGDPSAQLRGDNQHFWPHGLNYAHEANSVQDLIDHCRVVNAIYKDLFGEEFFGVYRLFSLSEEKCMTRSGNSLVLGSCTDSASLVRLISLGNNAYRLEFGDRVLDIPNESTAAGVVAGLWGWNGGNHQRAVFEEQQHSVNNVVRIRMLHSGHYLRADEERVLQDRATASIETQYWQMIPGEPITVVQRAENRNRNISVQDGAIFLSSAWKFGEEKVSMSIIDSRGRLIRSMMVDKEFRFSTVNLARGVYFLKLSGRDEVVSRIFVLP